MAFSDFIIQKTKKVMNNRLSIAYPLLSEEWSERNDISPESVTIGSHKTVWWKGKCGHEWQAIIKNRVKGSGCPYCSGNRVLKGFNDLKSINPILSQEWSEKNLPLLPDMVLSQSNKKVWWKGRCGHEWEARIADRLQGHGCPYCAGVILKGFNDLTTTHKYLSLEWSEKNSILPTQLSAKSREYVWWKCSKCGHEWKAVVDTRARGSGCPECRKISERKRREIYQKKKLERSNFNKDILKQALRYYTMKSGIEVINNDTSVTGLNIDCYYPKHHTGIVFSSPKEYTIQKGWQIFLNNERSNSLGIFLINILEPGMEGYSGFKCITRKDDSVKEIERVIKEIFIILDTQCDVDITRDRKDIFKIYKDNLEV